MFYYCNTILFNYKVYLDLSRTFLTRQYYIDVAIKKTRRTISHALVIHKLLEHSVIYKELTD